ncbi:uncharacterized protein C18orf19 homolog A-like [Watersipora subatra]|uniref:uncharacterized protein C18orf19 homolog A-like n=1 Tax=Watersipora subatra TaxID=2589382 RepID=UPI00355C3317
MALTTLRLTVRAGYQLCARTCPSRLVTTRTHCCPRYYYFSQGLFHPTSPVSNIPAQTFFTSSRLAFSSDTKQSKDEPQDEKGLTVFQRFTQVYKEYGKTLIAVHCVTSLLWYGGFYLVAQSGIDLLPFLVKMGASEAIQSKYSAAGDYVVAYILYEIAKPVRYISTLALTRQAVVYMRRMGYLPPIKPENKLRNLAKDGRDNLKDKYQEQKDDMKERYAKTKEVYRARLTTYSKRRTNRKHFYRTQNSHLHKPNAGYRHPKKHSESLRSKSSTK